MCKYHCYINVPLNKKGAEEDLWDLEASPNASTVSLTTDEFKALEVGIFTEFIKRYDMLIGLFEDDDLNNEYVDDAIKLTESYISKAHSDSEKSGLGKLLGSLNLAKETGFYVNINAYLILSSLPDRTNRPSDAAGTGKSIYPQWRPETGRPAFVEGPTIAQRFGRGRSLDVEGLEAFLEADARAHGIVFAADGWPVFPEGMLLADEPEDMLPFRQRNAAVNPARTVLCHFDVDERNYRRLESLDQDIPEYRRFMGMVGFDLSPVIQWDENQQKFNILLNMLATLYVGNRGVKIMPNFRTGDSSTITSLNAYPHGARYAVGALGCARGHVELNDFYLRLKTLVALPRKLYYYGALRSEYRATLDDLGVDYAVFPDFRQRSFHKGGSGADDADALSGDGGADGEE